MIQVQSGSSADLGDVMPVMAAAFPPETGEAWSQTQCAGALALPGTSLLLARHDGQVGGFAIVRSIADEAELLMIAVAPQHQRAGLGARLVESICSNLQSRNVTSLFVEVRHDNPAIYFYAHFGFEKIGERRNYYRRSDGHAGTALTLAKKFDQIGTNRIV